MKKESCNNITKTCWRKTPSLLKCAAETDHMIVKLNRILKWNKNTMRICVGYSPEELSRKGKEMRNPLAACRVTRVCVCEKNCSHTDLSYDSQDSGSYRETVSAVFRS